MISSTAEYALRMMIALGETDGQSLTSEQLSRRTDVSADYAVKILQQLGRAKFVRAQRGRGGGFRLARDPSEITLLELIRVIDPLDRITECPLNRSQHRGRLCALHASLDRVMLMLHNELSALRLSDLLDNDSQPICNSETHEPQSLRITSTAGNGRARRK